MANFSRYLQLAQSCRKYSDQGVQLSMTHLNKWGMAIALSLLIPIGGFAQESKVALVDFERVVVGTAAGKKAADQWNAKYAEHQKNLEARQKEIEDQQTKLRTQGNVLSEAAKAEIT